MVFDNNDELLYEGFDSFLQKVCFLLSECFLKEDLLDTEITRFHFRYYDEQDDRYKKLCASYPTYNREIKMENHKLSDMIWDDLIKESFRSRRPLIYSANKELCKSHALNQKWENFITIVFTETSFIYGRGRSERPLISFGITINNEKYNEFLYFLDCFRFNEILENGFKKYFDRFEINVKDYINYIKDRSNQNGQQL